MEKINAVITGVGGYVPDSILDNEEMSRIVDTSDEWIMERIGVKTRHILRPEQGSGTSYLMTRAVRQLLEKTQVDPASVEAVICATTTPDYHFPSTASIVIGNTTAGADGDVVGIQLPGGINSYFSGIGIYYPDGTETQRVGIIPDIYIWPTVKGIKEGRDELLEKALEWLAE